MQDHVYAFDQHAVESLGDAIMLQHVVHGKFLFCPFELQVPAKFFAQVLSTTVRLELFNDGAALCFHPSCIDFIDVEGVEFCSKEVEVCVTSIVVCKQHVKFLVTRGLNV